MSAGCKKADRNRKSAAMARYNGSKRDLINAKRKQEKDKKRKAKVKTLAVPRGMARALRRWKHGDTSPSHPSSLMSEKEWKLIKQSKVQRKKEQPMVLLNGLPMTPQQAAVVARRIEAERRQQATIPA